MAATQPHEHEEPTMSARDFDFLHGTWKSTQRRLAKRLAGSTEWD